MKTMICTLLVIVLLPTFTLAETIENSNPDGRIGDLIITCLAGMQTGNGDITSNNTIQEDNAGLSGFLFRLKLDAPISTKSTFLLRVGFDREKFSMSESNQYFKQESSIITILGGIKFYLNP